MTQWHGSGYILVTSHSLQRPMFNSRAVYVGFVQTTWHWDRFSSKHLQIYPISYHATNAPYLTTHLSLTLYNLSNCVTKIHWTSFFQSTHISWALVDQLINTETFWFSTNINSENITQQKEITFSLLKGDKLQGEQKWQKMMPRVKNWRLVSNYIASFQYSSMFQNTQEIPGDKAFWD